MDIIGIIINLVVGIIGGNITGAALKEKSLGWIGNTIAGAVGGVASGYILQAVNILNTAGMGNMTVENIIGNIATGGIGGAILTAIVTYIKNMISKSKSA